MKNFGLNKSSRLQTSAFQAVFANGRSAKSGDFKAIFKVTQIASEKNDTPVSLGIAVGKKNFKRAVARNRVKRLVREAIRTQMLPLKQQCLLKNVKVAVVILYRSSELPSFEYAKSHCLILLNEMQQRIEKHIPNEK